MSPASAVMAPDLTRVQARMLALLSDGQPHSRESLHALLWDTDAPVGNIHTHISTLRKKLRPLGQWIVCEYARRTIHYRRIILYAGSVSQPEQPKDLA